MKTKNINGLDIKVPKGSAFNFETAPELPKMHQLSLFVAKRGSGKSVSISNLVRMFGFDRVFIISPTIHSNKQMWTGLPIGLGDSFDDPDEAGIVQEIIDQIDAERDDLVRYRTELKEWEKRQRQKPSSQFQTLFGSEYDDPKPEHRWCGRIPRLALIIDDCQSTKLFNNRKFLNAVTRHRHLGQLPEGGAIGISMFVAIQNYKANSGGCPRVLRNNCTTLAVFKMKDNKELDAIYEEVAGEIDQETFEDVYAEATLEPYSFLFIDLHKKDNHPSMFRKRFNEFLIP